MNFLLYVRNIDYQSSNHPRKTIYSKVLKIPYYYKVNPFIDSFCDKYTFNIYKKNVYIDGGCESVLPESLR